MTTTENAPARTRAAQPSRPKLPREEDPRNPNHRLAAFFDEGTLELISADDDSGMLAAVGTVDGTHAVAFCSDATVMGGAMGDDGCKVVVKAYQRAMADRRRSSGSGTPVAPGSPRACCRCTRSA